MLLDVVDKHTIKYKGKGSIKKAVRSGKILRMTGGDSSEDNEEADDELDEKSVLRKAEKMLRKKYFEEAKDLYSLIVDKNTLEDGKTWVDSFASYRIVMCCLNMAKCHIRLGEYKEAIAVIDRCISCGTMKEGSKYNKVHLYQRLAAAYLMQMEYRASLLVCIYGLTQFNNDEKLLAIQAYINKRYIFCVVILIQKLVNKTD